MKRANEAAFFMSLVLAITGAPALSQSIDFSRYGVAVWQGRRATPVFSGPKDPDYMFRTAIRAGFATAPLAAGHYAIIQIGCGMECVGYVFGDVRDGHIIHFPIGGEYYPSLALTTAPDSRLVIAKWGVPFAETCKSRKYVLIGNEFAALGQIETHRSSDCINY